MLDIQIINHNYVTRIVVFSIFLYKNEIKNGNLYKRLVQDYIKNKFPNLLISISLPQEMHLIDKREIVIDKILNDYDGKVLSDLILVSFKTSLKEVNLQIDISDQDKYELFLYGWSLFIDVINFLISPS